MVGHSFGLMAAVYNFNRHSAGVNILFAAGLVSQAYYDDHFGFSSLNLVEEDLVVAQEVYRLLGADFSSDKTKAGASRYLLFCPHE